jgi:hypothetical protein
MKRIKLAIIICFLFVFSCCSVNAGDGAPAVEWDRTYGAINGYAVCSSDDGGYLIAGRTGDWLKYVYHGGGQWENETFLLIKTDAVGEVVWRKNYGMFFVRSAVSTSDGGYAFAGEGVANLIKTDSEGNVQWNRTYSAFDGSRIRSLIQTSDGGYAIAGFGDHPISGTEARLVKTDAEGNLQWNQTYGEPYESSEFYSIVETDDGYALAGQTTFDAAYNDYWLVKTDAYGNIQWNKNYGGTNSEHARSLLTTSDGGYVLAGENGDNFWLVKTDENGNMMWNQAYEHSGDAFMEAVQARDGGYVLAGRYLVIKVNATGELEWETDFPGKNIRHVIVSSDGGYVFAGWKGDSTLSESEVWAAKLESNHVHSVDFSAWFSSNWVTVTAAIVAVCVAVIVVGVVIYKRRQTTSKT